MLIAYPQADLRFLESTQYFIQYLFTYLLIYTYIYIYMKKKKRLFYFSFVKRRDYGVSIKNRAVYSRYVKGGVHN